MQESSIEILLPASSGALAAENAAITCTRHTYPATLRCSTGGSKLVMNIRITCATHLRTRQCWASICLQLSGTCQTRLASVYLITALLLSRNTRDPHVTPMAASLDPLNIPSYRPPSTAFLGEWILGWCSFSLQFVTFLLLDFRFVPPVGRHKSMRAAPFFYTLATAS